MPDYEASPGRLKINKDLGWAVEQELRQQCRELLRNPLPVITVDLTPARHVCSANLVAFAALGAMAQKEQKSLRLIVSPQAARAFELAGFKEFVDLEVRANSA